LKSLFRAADAISVPTYGLNLRVPVGHACWYLAGIAAHFPWYLEIDGECTMIMARLINILNVNSIN